MIHRPPQPQTDGLSLMAHERPTGRIFSIKDIHTMKSHPVLKQNPFRVRGRFVKSKQAVRWPDEARAHVVLAEKSLNLFGLPFGVQNPQAALPCRRIDELKTVGKVGPCIVIPFFRFSAALLTIVKNDITPLHIVPQPGKIITER